MSDTPGSPRVILLGNPASGRGRGDKTIDEALILLRSRVEVPRVLLTERPGHAVELARAAAAESPDLLVVVGGDGTVRDVVEGLSGAPVPVGLVPGGTGNDLARTLHIPREVLSAVEIALVGRARPLDVWLWNDLPFVNVTGLGLDAAVGAAVNRRFRRLHGTLAYVAGFAAVFPGFKPFPLALRWPGGEWSGGAWLAAFGNARCYGGGMHIAPDAEPDDGLLDVIVVEDVSRPVLLQQFPGIFTGRHLRHPRVNAYRVPEVQVDAPPQEVSVDGELIGKTPAVVRRAPAPFIVRVPAA